MQQAFLLEWFIQAKCWVLNLSFVAAGVPAKINILDILKTAEELEEDQTVEEGEFIICLCLIIFLHIRN